MSPHSKVMNRISLLPIIVLSFLFVGSAKAEKPLVVAHRGLLLDAPENTLANFRACLNLGLGFELDVSRTKDGRLVCIHDRTVNRTTNGTGAVASLNLAQLQSLDAGSWFSSRFRGERIPTIDEVFKLIAQHKERQVLIAVDLKDEHPATERTVVALAKKHGILNNCLMIGRAIRMAAVRRRLRQADPTTHVACLADKAKDLDAAIQDKDSDWVYVRYVPAHEHVQRIHKAGKRVFIAGPTVAGLQRGNWQAVSKAGMDGILTDYSIELARQLRGPRRYRRPTLKQLVERQKPAVLAIRKVGGKVRYDSRGIVIEVNLQETRATDSDLVHLRSLVYVREISLHRTRVKGPGLIHLRRLVRMEKLFLTDTALNDPAIAHLRPMKKLRVLGLSGTRVSDAGLKHLRGFKQLRSLFLLGSKVTDKGAEALEKRLPKCDITY